MGTLVLALALGILARSWLSPRIRLPYTCVVLIMGACVRAAPSGISRLGLEREWRGSVVVVAVVIK